MLQLANLPLSVIGLAFGMAAALVWWAGRQLPAMVAAIGAKTGLGKAFAGMLLLGGITTLPELATTSSAAAFGNGSLALNNALGSTAFNILLLALADAVLGRDALTSVLATPATLLQGVLGMLLLAITAVTILLGDQPIGGVGLGSSLLFLLCVAAMWFAAQYETRPSWKVINPPAAREIRSEPDTGLGLRLLLVRLAGLAALVLVGGALLSQSGDAFADRTDVGSGMVGLLLLATATSLPEVTVITAAIRDGHYEMAVGDIFGANLFNIAMIFIIDLFLPGAPVLQSAGSFEAVAALLALLLTGTFVIGLLERGDRTLFRMGYDTIAVLLIYAVGVVMLARLSG